jgi:hypothetical protein
VQKISVKALISIFKSNKNSKLYSKTIRQYCVLVYIVSQASRQRRAGQPDVARGPLVEYTAIWHWIFSTVDVGNREITVVSGTAIPSGGSLIGAFQKTRRKLSKYSFFYFSSYTLLSLPSL